MGRASSRCKSAADLSKVATTNGTVSSSSSPSSPCQPVGRLETVREIATPVSGGDNDDDDNEDSISCCFGGAEVALNNSILCRQGAQFKATQAARGRRSQRIQSRQRRQRRMSRTLSLDECEGGDVGGCCCDSSDIDCFEAGDILHRDIKHTTQVDVVCPKSVAIIPVEPSVETEVSKLMSTKLKPSPGDKLKKLKRSVGRNTKLEAARGNNSQIPNDDDDDCDNFANCHFDQTSSQTLVSIHPTCQVPQVNRRTKSKHRALSAWTEATAAAAATIRGEDQQIKGLKENDNDNEQRQCEQIRLPIATLKTTTLAATVEPKAQQVNPDDGLLDDGNSTTSCHSNTGSAFPCNLCCMSQCLDCDLPVPSSQADKLMTYTRVKANIYNSNENQLAIKQKQQINQSERLQRFNRPNDPVDCERCHLSPLPAVGSLEQQRIENKPYVVNMLKSINTQNGTREKFDKKEKQVKSAEKFKQTNDVIARSIDQSNQTYDEFIDNNTIKHYKNRLMNGNGNENSNANEKIGNKNINNFRPTFGNIHVYGDLDKGQKEGMVELEQTKQQQQNTSPLDKEIEAGLHESDKIDCKGNNNNNKNNNNQGNINKPEKSHMDWQNIVERYGRMPHQPHRGQLWFKIQQSCFCHVILSTLNFLFPFFTSFKNYSLPADLITDVISGFTVAILHIPQGMAYGLLAGVEPIHGLYVSLVPVLIMAFMSKSPHMSYGTFAVISILLANCLESIKQTMRQELGAATLTTATTTISGATTATTNESLASSNTETRPPTILSHLRRQNPIAAAANNEMSNLDLRDALIITNNHKPSDPGQQLLKNLLIPQPASDFGSSQAQDPQDSQSSWLNSLTQAAATAAEGQGNAAYLDNNGLAPFIMPTNIEILTCICLIVGLIQIAMALVRLGVLSLVFSDQLVSSFTTASAVHVATSQLGNLFDLSVPKVPHGPFKVCRIWLAFVAKFLDGFNHYTALLSLISLSFLIFIKELIEPKLKRRFKLPTCIPSELILMMVLIVCSWNWQFHANYNILVVGHVPTNLPVARAPRLDLVPWVLQDALMVAIVSFAMNVSLAQVCAKKFKYRLNSNQELFALGSANLISSFFSCFPCASSLSRTAVQTNLNARSQICSLVSCAIVVSIICYFAPFFHDLPRSTLSCIIVIALKGILFQIRDLYDNWCLSKLDALVWFATFMFVIAFDVTYGLVLGILTSLSMIFYRLITPNYSILGQLPDTEIYVAKEAFVECNEIDHVKIFRFNSALCYLNREMFKASVERLLQSANQQTMPGLCSQQKQFGNGNKIEHIIIDCSALAFCDYSGVSALIEVIDELQENNDIIVYLASCSLKLIRMIEKLKRTNLLEQNVYPSITDAVNQIRYLKNCNLRPPSPPDSNGHTSCLKSVISDST